MTAVKLPYEDTISSWEQEVHVQGRAGSCTAVEIPSGSSQGYLRSAEGFSSSQSSPLLGRHKGDKVTLVSPWAASSLSVACRCWTGLERESIPVQLHKLGAQLWRWSFPSLHPARSTQTIFSPIPKTPASSLRWERSQHIKTEHIFGNISI